MWQSGEILCVPVVVCRILVWMEGFMRCHAAQNCCVSKFDCPQRRRRETGVSLHTYTICTPVYRYGFGKAKALHDTMVVSTRTDHCCVDIDTRMYVCIYRYYFLFSLLCMEYSNRGWKLKNRKIDPGGVVSLFACCIIFTYTHACDTIWCGFYCMTWMTQRRWTCTAVQR